VLSGALPRGAFMLHALPLLTAAAVLLQRVSGRAESMGLQGEASVPQLQDVLPWSNLRHTLEHRAARCTQASLVLETASSPSGVLFMASAASAWGSQRASTLSPSSNVQAIRTRSTQSGRVGMSRRTPLVI